MSESPPVHEDTQPVELVSPPSGRRPQSKKDGGGCGCGCWIPAILTLLVVAALVVVGLLLPPFNLYERYFGAQYVMLDAQNNAAATTDRSLALIVDPSDPGVNFGVALHAIAPENIASSGADVREAFAATPPLMTLKSPLYTIATTGGKPNTFTLTVSAPPNLAPELLDLYAWNDAAKAWRFLPAQYNGQGGFTATVGDAPPKLALFQAQPQEEPLVLVSVDVTQTLTADAANVAAIVAPAGLTPTLEGKLTGSLAAGFDLNGSYLVMPVIRNFIDPRALDPETITAILSNSTLRGEHVAQIAAFASAGYDGVFIDYRMLPAEQRDNFSAFIRQLGKAMDDMGLLLGVIVPGAENIAGAWETGAYDWRTLGTAADFVEIKMPLDPPTYAPGEDRLVEAMLRWSVGEISRQKILMGVSAQSIQQVGGTLASIGYAEALAALGDVEIDADLTEADTVEPGAEIRARLSGFPAFVGKDETIHAVYVDYMNGDTLAARMWLTTPDSLNFRLGRTTQFALRGVGFDDLLASEVAESVLATILNYKLNLPLQLGETQDLALRWRIESVEAGVVGEVTTGLDGELVATIDAPDGNYAINVEVIGGDAKIPRGGAAVAVFAPTLTPTPVPTATPTPIPTPQPVVAAPAAQPVAAPSAGSIVGGFEYGGHVTSTATGAAGLMQSAGMTWMKVQVKYGIGLDPGAVSGYISEAHSRGFKVLLGIVGNKNELQAGGGSYLQQYAQFLAGVAALGPDAIEVWNEANIDREWPTGQISGVAYAEMLRQAYQAIKGANSSVMVISGAPAPTGAEAAFPGQVMNDDRWIGELIAAGGAQYMDCLGAHYNEGIVGPTQRSGDPRDGYYTRYFLGMVDTYWNISGGQRPICFTELGYLTPEGFPPLPSFFGWAQNVTLAQQAAWLAEAAALASQSGKVRLMIIWNIDFTQYGSDPMAGYAIIRPDGSCPACNALAAAR